MAAAQASPLVVFAGGTLQDAPQPVWRDAGGPPLRVSFAAAPALARQLGQGAGADLFLPAAGAWRDTAARTGDPRARALPDVLGSPGAAPVWRRHGVTQAGARA